MKKLLKPEAEKVGIKGASTGAILALGVGMLLKLQTYQIALLALGGSLLGTYVELESKREGPG